MTTKNDQPPATPRPESRKSGSGPVRKSGSRTTEGLGLEAETFFQEGGALESGQVPPPEEGTWMLKGTRKLARQARRSLPALVVLGIGFLALVTLLATRACSG